MARLRKRGPGILPKIAPPAFECAKTDDGLRLATENMGSSDALATALNIHRARVHHWERVPYSQLLAVESVTGIDRSILRPEIFAGWRPPPDFSPLPRSTARLPGSTNEEHLRKVRLAREERRLD